MRKNVAGYFVYTKPEKYWCPVQDKKFRTLSVDNFVRKWQGLH